MLFATMAAPTFAEQRAELPAPIYDEEPRWVEAYWKAWELAYRNFHDPPAGSGFVSRFMDAAINGNVFLWDSCFMAMFCDVAYPLVPGIRTLDNFYARQHRDGEICREIRRDTGADFEPWRNTERRPLFSRWGYTGDRRPVRVDYRRRQTPRRRPALTLDALNHPLLAWAELEHYRWTADTRRLDAVWDPLMRYYRALATYLVQGNGLYVTDWASMDNSPRNPYLAGGGTGVDISSEMVLFARQLAEIGRVVGRDSVARELERAAEGVASRINRRMWSAQHRFYLDLTLEGIPAPVRTVAAFWTLLARIATPDRAAALMEHLDDPDTFGRRNPVPSCAADEPAYDPRGGYWRGAVWAPTTTMVIRGLEAYGQPEMARQIALRHVALVSDVLARTGSIWENYAPDSAEPGRHVNGKPVGVDFVGWSGLGPILFLLEHAIGLRAEAPAGTLDWNLVSAQRCGCTQFRFGGRCVSLVAEAAGQGPRRVRLETDRPFHLRLRWRARQSDVTVPGGISEIRLP